MRSGLLQRAARRVVLGYPEPWRERYEGEVIALLEDSPARLRDVADLARGLVVERARSMFEPGDRPVLLATLVFLAGLARATVIAAPPILAGRAAHNWLGPAPREVATFTTLAIVVFVLTVIAARVFRKYLSTVVSFESGMARLSGRAGRFYLALVLPLTFLLSWSWANLIQALGLLWWFSPVWDQIAARRSWQVEMARAVHDVLTARQELKWALIELERCERLVADGMPAPLQGARNAVTLLERQRDEAMATLHSLGYRATLRMAGTSHLEHPNPEPNQNTN